MAKLLFPYCISGLYKRVAPVLPLFLVPLVPVARGARHKGRSGAKLGGPRSGVGQRRAPQRCSNAGVQSKVMHQQPQCFFPMPVALWVISLEQEKETASRRFSIGAFCAPRQTFRQGLSCILTQETKGDQAEPDPLQINGTSRAKPGMPCYVLMMEFSEWGCRCGCWQKWAVINRRYCLPVNSDIDLIQKLEADWGLEKTRHHPRLRWMRTPCHPVSCTPSSPRSGR